MNFKQYFEETVDEEILEKIREEKRSIGHYHLIEQDTKEFEDYAKNIKSKDILVIGMGGSVIGTKAIYSFIKSKKDLKKNLHFLDTTEPIKINKVISDLDIDDTHIVVVSKSGTTMEIVTLMNHLFSLKKDKSNITIITGHKNKLREFASKNKIQTFDIEDNISGRFSVLSPVGLVPLAMVGINIKELLEGAREVSDSFFDKGEHFENISKKAKYYFSNSQRFKYNCLFTYYSDLEDFNKWYVQLWAESIGKKNNMGNKVGLTPVSLIGPEDQHSFLQLLQEGPEDKSVTFIKVDTEFDIELDKVVFEIDDLSIKGSTFGKILDVQMHSIISALNDNTSMPIDQIELEGVNEKSIGALIFHYELLTSCIGQYYGINTYDQPGVEVGKKIFKERFNK